MWDVLSKYMPLLEAGHLMWFSRAQQRIDGRPILLQNCCFRII